MSAMGKAAKLEFDADETTDGAIGRTRTHWISPPTGGDRRPHSPSYLFRAWNEIKAQICNAQLCALLLDFDGTLVKIQRRPWEVRVPQRTKRLLERLSLNPKLFVAIVSGRRYQDLRTRIGIESLRYIGLHGAEEDGKSITIGTDAGRILLAAKCEAQKQIASMRGIRIEDKGLSFAVHYREATPPVAGAARSCLLQLVLPLHQSLKVFEGAMVWEVLPHEIQGKGAAARALLNTLPAGTPAIYIGDDETDESAFRSLSDEITVRVGRAKGTHAKYYLRNPGDVYDFLVRLESQIG
jgi:trehalose 6-phosphate phosphatase